MDIGRFLTRNSLTLIAIGAVAAGIALAVAGAGFSYADKPAFCGNCHSMNWVYATWQDSRHRQFTCGDCHIPQDSLLAKLYTKGENGMRHTYHETLRDYPAAIMLTPAAKSIANKNCLRCHSSTVENTFMALGGQPCIKCHEGTAHGKRMTRGGVKLE